MKYTWKKIKWPSNHREPYASWECWKLNIHNGYSVILYPGMWPKKGWSFVVDHKNPNADLSHSGFLPGKVKLDDAKHEIEQRIEQGWS